MYVLQGLQVPDEDNIDANYDVNAVSDSSLHTGMRYFPSDNWSRPLIFNTSARSSETVSTHSVPQDDEALRPAHVLAEMCKSEDAASIGSRSSGDFRSDPLLFSRIKRLTKRRLLERSSFSRTSQPMQRKFSSLNDRKGNDSARESPALIIRPIVAEDNPLDHCNYVELRFAKSDIDLVPTSYE